MSAEHRRTNRIAPLDKAGRLAIAIALIVYALAIATIFACVRLL